MKDCGFSSSLGEFTKWDFSWYTSRKNDLWVQRGTALSKSDDVFWVADESDRPG